MPAARGDGRQRAGGGRRVDDPRARAHRRARTRPWPCSTARGRCRAWTWPTCTSRWPSAPRGWAGTGTAPPRPRPRVRWWPWPRGDGMRRLYEELGALVVDGGPTMNPSTYELLAGVHAAGGAEVDRPAQQPQRDPGRRAGGRAVRAARARGAHDRAPGGAGGAAGLRPRPGGRAQRPGGGRGRRTRSCWAAWPSPPARTRRAASPSATPWATAATSWSSWGDPGQTLKDTLAAVADGAELVTCIVGEGAPLDERRDRAGGAGRGGAGAPGGWPARLVVAPLR